MLRRALAAWLLAALLPFLLAATALAQPVLRVGDHKDYGRLVFGFPSHVTFQVARDADHLVLQFAATGADAARLLAIPGLVDRPRNLAGFTGGQGRAVLDLAPGVRTHVQRLGNRIVVDLFDPHPDAPPHATAPPRAARSRVPVPRSHVAALPAPPPLPLPLLPPAPAAEASAAPTPAVQSQAPQPPSLVTAAAAAGWAVLGPNGAPLPVIATAPIMPVQQDAPPPPTPLAATSAVAPPGPPPADVAAPARVGPDLAAWRDLPPDDADAASAPPALGLPFPPNAGAAVFRRGELGLAVFDVRLPIDMSALEADPVFGGATVRMLPGGTLISLKLAPEAALALRPAPGGWLLVLLPAGQALAQGANVLMPRPDLPPPAAAAPPGKPAPEAKPAAPPLPKLPEFVGLAFAMKLPGQMLELPDPLSGRNLLVGTQRREAADPAQGLSVARRAPQFRLLPSWQGLVVTPLSDRLTLRAGLHRFHLAADGQDLPLAGASDTADALVEAAAFTRRFDFPDLPPQALMRQLRVALDVAAASPRLARYRPRLAAAQVMIALGEGAEARSVLAVAAEDDAAQANSPELLGLRAIADLLVAGDLPSSNEAQGSADVADAMAGLEDPRLSGTDEMALWHAMAKARQAPADAGAAAQFAATYHLVESYPETLRARLLPIIAQSLVQGGQPAVASRLLDAHRADPRLDPARAMLLENQGSLPQALAAQERLASSPDRLVHARAAQRGVELRLASHAISQAAAADALAMQYYDWRGDGREQALRRRVAQLRAQAGQWRQALLELREAMALFPADAPAIRAQLAQSFAAMLHDVGSLTPLDMVAVMEENADLVPDDPALSALLADRLVALDLPDRAAPLLERLMRAAADGPARADFGARLAAMRLEQNDPVAALAALGESAGGDVPPALTERRSLLASRAEALRNNRPAALAALSNLASPAVDDARARLLEDAKDWPGAEAALADLVARTVPVTGPLTDDQQQTLLRLAGAAAQAADQARLAALRPLAGRMENAQLADMFRLLTADPVRRIADLPQAATNLGLAQQLPHSLQALSAR